MSNVNEMSAKVMLGQQGKNLLELDGYCFRKDRDMASSEISWRCCKNKCSVSLRTIGATYVITHTNGHQHNHEKMSDRTAERRRLSASAKRKAENDICERPSKVLRSLMTENTTETLQKSDILKIKRNMYNARCKHLPTLPKTRYEVQEAVCGMNLRTIRGEEFVVMNDTDSGIIVYTCLTNLRALVAATALYIDGTFKYCPKFYYQFLTIHGFFSGHYVPLVFCLLPNKEEATYTLCFNALSDICACHQLDFRPPLIVTDFEMGLQNSCSSAWPSAVLKACRFHLTQAWWRRIQKVGLATDYMNDTEVGKWLKLFFGLLFLKLTDVEPCYHEILAKQPENSKPIESFSKYIYNTYISRGVKYPPEIWACPTSNLDETTNACESFHSHLSENFDSHHPNIFKFSEFLLDYQKEVLISLNSCGEEKRTRNSHTRQKQAFVKSQLEKYTSNETSAFDVVHRLSHYYSHTC
ncbi:hypothetical protein V9T40_003326 [Parthenolecanium corni]|uniref:MULE transposase domain-containing protein n=1 Tax=Parthenolecanium corni TaxID=536013 RepID=A0AAN9TSY7_9HEMI